MEWITRVILLAAWGALGAVFTYGMIQFLTPLGWLLLGGSAAAGVALYYLSGQRRKEVLGVFAGPGLFLIALGISGDHELPLSPTPWGVFAILPVVAVYAMQLVTGGDADRDRD